MGKWQGTAVPNSGYVDKVYFNNNLSVEETVNILSKLTYTQTPFLYYPLYPILFSSDGTPVVFAVNVNGKYEINIAYDLANQVFDRIFLSYDNVDGNKKGFHRTECDINKSVISEYSGLPIGFENDLISSLVSSTPFTQSQPTTADKLQKLIDGKQYVIDKINAKAETSLPLNCTWQELGDTIENISGGSGGATSANSLKKLLDYTKSCRKMFDNNKTITDLTGYLEYSDTENVTSMYSMFYSCTKLTTIPLLDTKNVGGMGSMFYNCSNLTTIPQLNTSNVDDMSYMFNNCSKLTTIPQLNTSNVTNMGSMFNGCSKLVKIDLTYYKIGMTSNSSYWCTACYSLKAVIIREFGTSYALNSNAFNNCYHFTGTVNSTYNPNGDKDGYIYVPRNMVDTLKSATNWSAYASQIRALEDYTVDGTSTGELDESKVSL